MTEATKEQTWSVFWLTLAASIIAGMVVGGLWRLVAPTPEMVVRGQGVGYVRLTDSGVGMDLSFGALCIAAGIAVAISVMMVFRHAAFVALLGVAVGGIVGSLVAWRFGMFLDPGVGEYGPELATGRADGETFRGPLVLSALGVLALWTLVGCATLALGFGRRARKLRIEIEKTHVSQEPPVSTGA